VILIARNGESLKRTVAELPKTKGQEHDSIAVDSADPADLKQVLQKT
jgi:short-subunit dehydrogenase